MLPAALYVPDWRIELFKEETVSAVQIEFEPLASVEASDLFEDESVDWEFCVERATFQHKSPDACEFILHIGQDPADDDSYFRAKVEEMREFGCTEEFVAAYTAAKEAGAVRVLFWA